MNLDYVQKFSSELYSFLLLSLLLNLLKFLGKEAMQIIFSKALNILYILMDFQMGYYQKQQPKYW